MTEQWRTVTIKDIGRVITGRTPPASHPEYFGDYIPFITPTDMDGRRIIDEPIRYLSENGAHALRNIIVPSGIGVSCIGWQMGKSILISEPSVTNQQINSIIPDIKLVDQLFLYYSLVMRREEIFRYGSGGSRTPILKKSAFEKLELELPPLDEQRAIARVLGVLDDKIEHNRRMNRTLEQAAEALFSSWFVNFDPVVAKAEGRQPCAMPPEVAALFPDRFVESPVGPVPARWTVSTIGEEVKVVGGSTPSTSEPAFWEGDIHWITPRDLSKLNDPIVLTTERTITKAGLAKISSGLLPVGTIILSSRAPIGYLAYAEIPVAINQGFIAMRCQGRLSKHYVFQWVKENMEEILTRAGGTTFAEISKANFRPIPAIVPSQDVLAAFDAIIEPLHQRLVATVKNSLKLTNTRDLLFPQLLSGDLRLPEAERQLAEVL